MIEILIIIFLILIFLNTLNNLLTYNLKSKEIKKFPFVSILVPVRNEEKRIRDCLLSLVNLDYPNYEIIVLNDNSEDNSLKIIKELAEKNDKIRYFNGEAIENGWTGKSFACYQLAQKAKGEWFLFTDADTIHKKSCLKVMINEARERKIDFLTLLPYKTTGSIIGKIFLPIINFFFCSLFISPLLNSKYEIFSFAIGPFILVKKNIYWKIDGHKSVKNEIVEDVALSRKIKSVNGKIACVNGTDYMTVFYYNNFSEVWNGFSKNFFGALKNSIFIALFLITFVTIFFLYPTFHLLYNILFYSTFSYFNIVQLIIIFGIFAMLVFFYKEPIYIIIFYPICFIITYLILFNSIYLSITKKLILWKNRTYEV